MKLKKAVPTGILIILAFVGLRHWLDKPYCTIELLESHTQREKKNIIVYSLSKLLSQRRDLHGNDPYTLYMRVDDPDGFRFVQLTIDDQPVKLDMSPDAKSLQKEIPGKTEFGLHRYVVTVTDRKGNTARAESQIKVSSPGGFAPVL